MSWTFCSDHGGTQTRDRQAALNGAGGRLAKRSSKRGVGIACIFWAHSGGTGRLRGRRVRRHNQVDSGELVQGGSGRVVLEKGLGCKPAAGRICR